MEMDFNEDKAIELMRAAVPADRAALYTDDELLNVIDMIWDYYEENGLLDIDADPDDDADDVESEVIDYVVRMLKKDKDACIAVEDVPLMVKAVMEYEDSVI